MIDPLEIERVAKWTGQHLTGDEYLKLLQKERTKIEPLPTANSASPRGDKLQDLVTVALPHFLATAESVTRLQTKRKKC